MSAVFVILQTNCAWYLNKHATSIFEHTIELQVNLPTFRTGQESNVQISRSLRGAARGAGGAGAVPVPLRGYSARRRCDFLPRYPHRPSAVPAQGDILPLENMNLLMTTMLTFQNFQLEFGLKTSRITLKNL